MHYQNEVIYHIFPLGLCGGPQWNDHASSPIDRLSAMTPWLDHAAQLGCTAVLLGPVFESGSHGYDTADYFWVDRRLGDQQSLARLTDRAHRLGLKVILDGVFNHVGREFWAFRDVREKGPGSPYSDWFSGLRFGCANRSGDPFCYDTWNSHESLVKLNLCHPLVRQHLLLAVESWMRDYHIDGLRLDAADVLDHEFQAELAAFCRGIQPGFWLMGEVVGGDYRKWTNPGMLDSVTNYECYKGLYSSHIDHNYYEIAWSLNRQFGREGLYRGIGLFNFADNHDVNRLASQLKNPKHLALVYTLLFTMPGVPSVYYGSEFGVEGLKGQTDWGLRPSLDLEALRSHESAPGLTQVIRQLINIRKGSAALTAGDYQQVYLANEQFAFIRSLDSEAMLIVLNCSLEEKRIYLDLPGGAPRFATPRFGEPRVNLDASGLSISVAGDSASLVSLMY